MCVEMYIYMLIFEHIRIRMCIHMYKYVYGYACGCGYGDECVGCGYIVTFIRESVLYAHMEINAHIIVCTHGDQCLHAYFTSAESASK